VKKTYVILFNSLILGIGFVFVFSNQAGPRAIAQQDDTPKMPGVIIMAKDAKLGSVKFDHIKHNGGTYTIDQSGSIGCAECHHTARPADEIAKHPPLKTAWPAERTTTLTAELFTKDPRGAGVVGCADCHARTGAKPKLIAAIPEIKHEGSTALITLNNQNALHRTCAGCHAEVRKAIPASKAPVQAQCTLCHKKSN
jgi:hypothetical protein